MNFTLDQRREGPDDEPTLADMTEKAIRILRRGNNGYFLLVEGNSGFCVLVIDEGIRERTKLRCVY